jgi:uncharacterized protein (DUF2062 family)
MLVRFRLRVLELLRLNGSPHGIALGFTLGVALSLIPVPFLGMFVALALAPLLRANLPATYFGTAVINPVTGAPIYFSELWVGASLLDVQAPSWAEAKGFDGEQWLALVGELLPAFGLGALVVACGATLISYPLLRLIVSRFQARHQPTVESEDAAPNMPR